MIPDLTPAEITRFYSKLRLGGCGIVWSGPVNNKGYGRFEIYRGGKRVRILAHRLTYRLATGEDPGELVIRHQCDTPPCCTIDCFLLGTQAENVQDAVSRGRANIRGLRNWHLARDERVRQRLASGWKCCPRCKIIKALTEFYRASRSADGRAYWCKACEAEHRRGVNFENQDHASDREASMTTLISYSSSGGDQGRCDAKCYDAREPDCECICAGRNHGAGREQAIENTRELAESWVEQARANGHDITGFELAVDAMHEPLFSLGGAR